jgi:hypothetical protein
MEIVTKEQADRIEKKLDRLLAVVPQKRTVNLRDIAMEQGVPLNSVRQCPWLQPNFGESEFTGKEKRWSRDLYESWYEVSPKERKAQWLNKSRRRRIDV